MRKKIIYTVAILICLIQIHPSFAQPAEKSAIKLNIEITQGNKNPLCQAYANGLKEWKVASTTYCGFAMPSGDDDFRLPLWENLDASAHMDIVREMFYWSNIAIGPLSREEFERQYHAYDIIQEFFTRIWLPARSEVESLVAEGKVQLQRTLMDFDHDGKNEPVYRMIYVYRPYKLRRPPAAGVDYQAVTTDMNVIATCSRTALPGGDQLFVYFVRKEDSFGSYRYLSGRHLMPGSELFFWRRRSYVREVNELGDAVFYPASKDRPQAMNLNTVCSIRSRLAPIQ